MNKKIITLPIYELQKKVVQGKSADISQNVCLGELFQNLKTSYMEFVFSLRGPSSTL